MSPDTQPQAMALARKWFRCPCGTPYGERRDYDGNSPPDDEPHAPEDFDAGVERMTAEIVAYAADPRNYLKPMKALLAERDAALAKLEAAEDCSACPKDRPEGPHSRHDGRPCSFHDGACEDTAANLTLWCRCGRTESDDNAARLAKQLIAAEERVRVLEAALSEIAQETATVTETVFSLHVAEVALTALDAKAAAGPNEGAKK